MTKRQSPGFLTKLYHFWGAHLDAEEFTFYEALLQEADGKALELSCGSGRLLIPFLQKGYSIEGVEPAKELVDLLNHKLKDSEIKPKISQQKLEELDLGRLKYDLIYIPLGSLQLIKDPADVELLLSKIKRHLTENGKAVFPLFLPWASGAIGSDKWRVVTNVLSKKSGMRKVSREKIAHDPVEQLIQGKVRFEVWKGKEPLDVQEKEISVRWYSKGEFQKMLISAGFSKVTFRRTYLPNKPRRDAFMLFIAK